MSGPFEAFLDKGYVTCVQETVIECLPSPTKSLLRLDLSQLLMFHDYFDLPRNLSVRLMRASLSDKNENVVSRRTLKRYYDDDMRGVKKILAYEKVFLDRKGEIPSGKTVNDLLGYIWGQSWEEYNELKMKKKIREDKKKKVDDSVSQLDSDIADDDLDDANDKMDESDDNVATTVLPDNYKCPDIVPDGKWYPAGYPTYFCYVCPFTRVNDEYVHLFMGDGKQLDESKAMNRKEERQKKMKEKNLQRDKDLLNGKKRGMDKESSILFSLAAQNEVENLVLELDVLGREMKDLKEMAHFIHDGDKSAILKSEEWVQILALQKTRLEIREMLNNARNKKRKSETISLK